MKTNANFVIALVTAPNLRTARRLAKAALQARLAACANLIPKIESRYWWQGKLEKGSEVLLLLKTRTSLVRRLEQVIVDTHPYDTPEFILLDVQGGNGKYLDWWRGCLARQTRKHAGIGKTPY